MVEQRPENSVVFFQKALIPFIRALLSWPSHLPKSPSPNTITLRIPISEFGATLPLIPLLRPSLQIVYHRKEL